MVTVSDDRLGGQTSVVIIIHALNGYASVCMVVVGWTDVSVESTMPMVWVGTHGGVCIRVWPTTLCMVGHVCAVCVLCYRMDRNAPLCDGILSRSG